MSRSPIEMKAFLSARGAKPEGGLPDDPALLAHYHTLATDLLARMAERLEPDWDLAETALDEIDRLLNLQARIVRRLAARTAESPADIALKLSLWALARQGTAERDLPAEDCLVHSALRDLEAMLDDETQPTSSPR